MYYTDGSGAIGSAKHTGWDSSPKYINNDDDKKKYPNLDISAFMVPNPQQTTHIAHGNTMQDEGGFNA